MVKKKLEEIAETAMSTVAALTKLKPAGVVGLAKSEDKWIVKIELVEKESIPSALDILGLYEAIVDEEGNILEFRRKSLRSRSDTEQEE